MWTQRKGAIGGPSQFFRITVGGESLMAYYAINSTLMLHYKYSLHDLEHMIPWERDLYVMFVEQHVKEQNEQIKNARGS